MPKYDDFGRPIYETAEEYNKAHREGKTARTYTSTDGDTYKHTSTVKSYNNTKKKPKKSTILIIGVSVYFIVMIVFLIFNMARDSFSDIYEVLEEEVPVDIIDSDEEYEEYVGDAVTPLPEGFETFIYNGQVYTLPATMEEILAMGFTLEEAYDEDYMLPTQYEETLILNGEDGYMYAMVGVSNYTDEEVPLEKATVHYFYMDNTAVYDVEEEIPDFVFGDGLTFESSYEELEAYLGVPFYHYGDHSEEDCYYDNFEWAYYGEDEIHFVSITFWNGVISDVGIEKRVIE